MSHQRPESKTRGDQSTITQHRKARLIGRQNGKSTPSWLALSLLTSSSHNTHHIDIVVRLPSTMCCACSLLQAHHLHLYRREPRIPITSGMEDALSIRPEPSTKIIEYFSPSYRRLYRLLYGVSSIKPKRVTFTHALPIKSKPNDEIHQNCVNTPDPYLGKVALVIANLSTNAYSTSNSARPSSIRRRCNHRHPTTAHRAACRCLLYRRLREYRRSGTDGAVERETGRRKSFAGVAEACSRARDVSFQLSEKT